MLQDDVNFRIRPEGKKKMYNTRKSEWRGRRRRKLVQNSEFQKKITQQPTRIMWKHKHERKMPTRSQDEAFKVSPQLFRYILLQSNTDSIIRCESHLFKISSLWNYALFTDSWCCINLPCYLTSVLIYSFFYLTLKYKLNRQHNTEWNTGYKPWLAKDVENTTHFQVDLRGPRINGIRDCKLMNIEEEREKKYEKSRQILMRYGRTVSFSLLLSCSNTNDGLRF